MERPYVEYLFDGTKLAKVLQSREGDPTTANGFSDVGTFLLGTAGLTEAWDGYLARARAAPSPEKSISCRSCHSFRPRAGP